jgi:hypothetical protein
MDNVAIIGNSPIMLILANHLRKQKIKKITIIKEKKKVGGAWSYFKFKNRLISNQTNVIVPASKYEEKLQSKINDVLERDFLIKIEEAQGFHKPNVYLAPKNYKYNLKKLYDSEKNFIQKEKYVKKIYLRDNDVSIGREKYDKIYLPYFNGVKSIIKDEEQFNIESNIIVSKHIMLIFKKLPIEDFIYTENFDEVFDRAQITKFKNFTSFTARVRKPYKDQTIEKLIKISIIQKYIHNNNLLLKRTCKYKNYYRDEQNIKDLKQILDKSNVELVNTWQFYEGFIDLNKKHLKYF